MSRLSRKKGITFQIFKYCKSTICKSILELEADNSNDNVVCGVIHTTVFLLVCLRDSGEEREEAEGNVVIHFCRSILHFGKQPINLVIETK